MNNNVEKSWRHFLCSWLCLLPAVIAVLLRIILPHFPQLTETVFSRGLFRVLSAAVGGVTVLLPFSLTEVLVVLALPAVLVLAVLFIRRLIRSRAKGQTALRAVRGVAGVLSCTLLYYMLMHGINFYRLPVSQLMDLDVGTKSAQELLTVCIDLADKASAERAALAEDEKGCMQLSVSKSEILAQADGGYRKLEGQYPFLWGAVWRAKPVQLSHWWSYTGITGMYFPFFAEANVNIDVPDSDIPATAAHELAHTRGFAQEDECNFFAYLTSIHSDSAECRYSGYLLAYIYCANALYGYDQELWRQAYSHCSEAVRRDLNERNAYWDAFKGKIQETSDKINDGFIKSQGVQDGVLSYNRVVQLILGYYASGRP